MKHYLPQGGLTTSAAQQLFPPLPDLEELLEILTWAQLGLHAKPCGLLDLAGYYRPLREMLSHAAGEGFLRPEHEQLLVCASDPGDLLARLEHHQPPQLPKWLDRDET